MRLRSASINNHFDEALLFEYLRIEATSQLVSENVTSIVAASGF